MHRVFTEVWEKSKEHRGSLRQGAHFPAIERVAEATTTAASIPETGRQGQRPIAFSVGLRIP